jgi:hypothetical protein
VYYPLGGFGKVRDGLLEVLQQAGGTVRTGAQVKQITTRGGAVTGVTLTGGEQLPAAVVVSNRWRLVCVGAVKTLHVMGAGSQHVVTELGLMGWMRLAGAGTLGEVTGPQGGEGSRF